MGGDYASGGLADKKIKSTFGKLFVSRLSEPRHPSRLLVFASARYDDEVGLPTGWSSVEGHHRVDPPYLMDLVWKPGYNLDGPASDYGHISLRHSLEAVIAFFDGHTGTLDEVEIRDMRHWSDQATHPDWTVSEP